MVMPFTIASPCCTTLITRRVVERLVQAHPVLFEMKCCPKCLGPPDLARRQHLGDTEDEMQSATRSLLHHDAIP